MPSEASLANLQPAWQPGSQPNARRSRDVEKGLRIFRRATPEAAEHCIQMMRHGEDERVRLKAAEIILQHGMPKGEAALRAFADGDVTAITIHVEHHTEPAKHVEQAEGPVGPVITIDTEPAGSGD